ncbi:MAG: class I SAM-dependent methyltransferase [Planctomycetota bacterium]|nr:class I SAM-dependent methyltransferase [Planctomycetota bacterium]
MSDLYRLAELYDLAFAYRDYGVECDFLEAAYARHRGATPASFLELAAGPARHALEMARRGRRAIGIDRSPQMRAHALGLAAEQGLSLEYVEADLVEFSLDSKVDLAALMLNSAAYLHDNDAFASHLDRVADHLTEDGIYVLEMNHPRDVIGSDPAAESHWTATEGELKLEVTWGEPEDRLDPLTLIADLTVSLAWSVGDRSSLHIGRSRERRFLANEVLALVAASGRFEVLARYGALDADVPFDDDPRAWRMVVVLGKRAL